MNWPRLMAALALCLALPAALAQQILTVAADTSLGAALSVVTS